MSSGSGNVSNVLSLGGANSSVAPITIPEANSQGYFTLYGGGAPGTNNFGVFYKNGVAYQVTAGKTCKVIGIVFESSSASEFFQLASATSSFAQGAGSLTGGVYQMGAVNLIGFMTSPTASVQISMGITYDFAASTFAGWQSSQSGGAFSIQLICKEV